ncbi:MAG: signal protein PDZ [Micrococcales bacterium]|nr:MAG: signal protein PDZ [Micrococcales bacterium]PIE26163.1 MAG: signal protein PDZ [Micrococcales bacterium]
MATVPGGSEPVPDLPSSGEPGSTRARRRAHVRPRVGPADPRLVVSAFAGAVVMCSAAVLGAAPVPYAALSPGPVSNVLGSTGDTPMIDVSGRQTYPTNGELDLLTASVRGGPNNSLSMAEVVSGWVDRSVVVRPVQEIYPADLTSEQISERNTAQMESSQESATAAALHELGIEVPTRLTIDRFVDTGQAEGPLREGDRIVAVGGTEVASMAVLREQVQQVEPGGSASVTVIRAGRRVQEPVPTTESPEGDTLLGVVINPTFDFPFTVKISIDRVGGPSAGMMFALGIVDKLTPGALTGGKTIAGTGTISSDGQVGAVGAVRQKLVAADDGGAELFLVPAGNCAEVAGYAPDGLRVVKIASLSDAVRAVQTFAADENATLPTCS